MKKIKNVLFVCLGNTARSPVACYLARNLKNKYNILEDVNFDSAGFMNMFSYMQPESRAYLNTKGVDHSDFRPKKLNKNLLEKQDLIITMELSHKNDILLSYRDIKDLQKKVFTLKEFNGIQENLDIIDPYYTNKDTYDKIMKSIEKNVEMMVEKIVRFNGSN